MAKDGWISQEQKRNFFASTRRLIQVKDNPQARYVCDEIKMSSKSLDRLTSYVRFHFDKFVNGGSRVLELEEAISLIRPASSIREVFGGYRNYQSI